MPTLGCWALTAVVFWCGTYAGWRLLDPSNEQSYASTFLHHDGQHYNHLVIAGYTYAPGSRSELAFFPAFPISARALRAATGVYPIAALLIVSHLFLAAAFVALAVYLRTRHGTQVSARGAGEPPRSLDVVDYRSTERAYTLLAFAVAPCSFFFRLAYSESCFLFFAILTLLAIERRWPLAWIVFLVGLTTATRPVGVALILPFLWHLRKRTENRRMFYVRSALLIPLAMWGLLAYMVFQYVKFGSPFIFVTTQEHWRVGAAEPLWDKALALASWEPIWSVYVPGTRGYWRSFGSGDVPFFDLRFMNPIYFVGTAALIGIGAWKRWLTSYEIMVSATLLAIPYLTKAYENAMASQSRFAAVVFPAYIVIGELLVRLPREIALSLLCLSAFLMGIYSAEYAAGKGFY